MEQASLVLFWFAFTLFIGATVLYAYQFLLRRQKVAWWARFLTGAGFICQTLSIGANSVANQGTPLNGSNQLILASWALVLLYFTMEHAIRIRAYGTFLVPVTVVLMAIAQLVGGGDSGVLDPDVAKQLDGAGVAFHVALIVFANAGFAVAAVSSALYLYQGRMLKRHMTGLLSRRLPSLATLQDVTRRSVALSYPVYTAGLTLGIIRAIKTVDSGWWLDPRIMMSGVVWFVYGLYLTLVYRHDVSSRTASAIALGGFVFVAAVAIIARTLPIGFHVFGQL